MSPLLLGIVVVLVVGLIWATDRIDELKSAKRWVQLLILVLGIAFILLRSKALLH